MEDKANNHVASIVKRPHGLRVYYHEDNCTHLVKNQCSETHSPPPQQKEKKHAIISTGLHKSKINKRGVPQKEEEPLELSRAERKPRF